MNEKTKDFIRAHLPLLSFAFFVLISIITLICFQSKSLRDLKERNDKILAHYEQILNVESKKKTVKNVDVEHYAKVFDLSTAQSVALQNYTNSIVETAISKSQAETDVNALVEAKAVAMFQETKDMLEMQFAKIQHETESLQIWCGILTVVFLIFSFYSLFKTDELVQQGRDGVEELKNLQTKANNSIEQMENTGNSKISDFDTKSKATLKGVENAIKVDEKKVSEFVKQKTEDFSTIFDQKVIEATQLMDQKYGDLSQALANSIQEKENVEKSKENELLDKVIKSLEVLSLRVDELEHKNINGNG